MKIKLIISFILITNIFFIGCEKDNSNINSTEASNSQQEISDNEVKEEENNAKKELLNNILDYAREGKVIGCEFASKANNIEDVIAMWGNDDKHDYVAEAKGIYYTFNNKGIVFGVNKGSQIFEVRTYGKEISILSLNDIKEFLGEPQYDVTTSSDERIIGYVVNSDFRIEFVFSKGTKDNPSIDHYLVLYPAGTVNSMADDPGRQW